MRTIDEIIDGDSETLAQLSEDELLAEHEILRRHVDTARKQISVWSPYVAWRHKYWETFAKAIEQLEQMQAVEQLVQMPHPEIASAIKLMNEIADHTEWMTVK